MLLVMCRLELFEWHRPGRKNLKVASKYNEEPPKNGGAIFTKPHVSNPAALVMG